MPEEKVRKLRLPGVQGDRDGRVDGLADLEHAAVVEDGVTEVGQRVEQDVELLRHKLGRTRRRANDSRTPSHRRSRRP